MQVIFLGKNDSPDTRQRILQAALRIFSLKGYHGASMRAIAEDAGLSLGGIYAHFAGKEELFNALLEEQGIPSLLEGAMELFYRAGGLEELEKALSVVAMTMYHEFRERFDFFRLLFIDFLEFEGKHARELVRRNLLNVLGRADWLPAAMARGKMRRLNPYIVVRAWGGIIIAFLITEKMLFRGLSPLPEEEMLKGLLDIFFRGVLPREGNEPGPQGG